MYAKKKNAGIEDKRYEYVKDFMARINAKSHGKFLVNTSQL